MPVRDWFIVKDTSPQASSKDKKRKLAVMRSVQSEGASARAAGLSIDKCPKFVDPDMAVDWQIGWNYEDSILSGKRDRKTGLLKDI